MGNVSFNANPGLNMYLRPMLHIHTAPVYMYIYSYRTGADNKDRIVAVSKLINQAYKQNQTFQCCRLYAKLLLPVSCSHRIERVGRALISEASGVTRGWGYITNWKILLACSFKLCGRFFSGGLPWVDCLPGAGPTAKRLAANIGHGAAASAATSNRCVQQLLIWISRSFVLC